MKKIFQFIFILLLSITHIQAQDGYDYTDEIQVLYGFVFNGDTIPMLSVPEISITGHKFDNQEDEYWYNYYLKRVKKVYPY